MSEPLETIDDPNGASAVEKLVPVSAGEALRRARQAAGLHIAALAVTLKVPVKKLEALESNRFDLLPDAVFVRALAASVCRSLKIESAPILALLPATSSPRLVYQGAGINEAFRSPGDAPSPSTWAHASKPAVLMGLALLLGALVLIFLPAMKAGLVDATSTITQSPLVGSINTAVAVDANAAADSQALPKTTLPNELPEPGTAVMNGTTGSSPKTSLSPNDASQVQVVASPTASSPAPISGSTGPVLGAALGTSSPTFVINASPTSASDIVVFTAKGDSWVEATDAKGQVVLRRMLANGEIAGAAGLLPLKVVVGRANMTQVQIRGKGFDLGPVSKDNVARFEVK